MAGGGGGDGAVDTTTGEFIAICTLGGVLLLQWLMSRLEHSVNEHRHASEMLRVMYKELTILGVVAFVLFTIEAFGAEVSTETKHQFEVIHITLFIIAVFYAALVILFVILSLVIARSWRRQEETYSHFSEWKTLKLRHRQLKQKLLLRKSQQNVSRMRKFWVRASQPRVLWRYWHTLTVTRFSEQKLRLIMRYNLPRTFAFTFYLRKCKQHVFYELVEIPYSLWVIFAWAIAVDLYLRGVWSGYDTAVSSDVLVIAGSVVVILICLILFIKIRSIYWKVVHSETVRAKVSDSDLQQSHSWDDLFRRMKETRIRKQRSVQQDPHKIERKQRDLFWFRRPAFMIRLLQAAMFLTSLVVALAILFWSEVPETAAAVVSVLGAALVILVYTSVRILPLYVFSIHLGEMVDWHLLISAAEKHLEVLDNARMERMRKIVKRRLQQKLGPPTRRKRLERCLHYKAVSLLIATLVLTEFFLVALLSAEFISSDLRVAVEIVVVVISVIVCVDMFLWLYALGVNRFFCQPYSVFTIVALLSAITALVMACLALAGVVPVPVVAIAALHILRIVLVFESVSNDKRDPSSNLDMIVDVALSKYNLLPESRNPDDFGEDPTHSSQPVNRVRAWTLRQAFMGREGDPRIQNALAEAERIVANAFSTMRASRRQITGGPADSAQRPAAPAADGIRESETGEHSQAVGEDYAGEDPSAVSFMPYEVWPGVLGVPYTGFAGAMVEPSGIPRRRSFSLAAELHWQCATDRFRAEKRGRYSHWSQGGGGMAQHDSDSERKEEEPELDEVFAHPPSSWPRSKSFDDLHPRTWRRRRAAWAAFTEVTYASEAWTVYAAFEREARAQHASGPHPLNLFTSRTDGEEPGVIRIEPTGSSSILHREASESQLLLESFDGRAPGFPIFAGAGTGIAYAQESRGLGVQGDSSAFTFFPNVPSGSPLQRDSSPWMAPGRSRGGTHPRLLLPWEEEKKSELEHTQSRHDHVLDNASMESVVEDKLSREEHEVEGPRKVYAHYVDEQGWRAESREGEGIEATRQGTPPHLPPQHPRAGAVHKPMAHQLAKLREEVLGEQSSGPPSRSRGSSPRHRSSSSLKLPRFSPSSEESKGLRDTGKVSSLAELQTAERPPSAGRPGSRNRSQSLLPLPAVRPPPGSPFLYLRSTTPRGHGPGQPKPRPSSLLLSLNRPSSRDSSSPHIRSATETSRPSLFKKPLPLSARRERTFSFAPLKISTGTGRAGSQPEISIKPQTSRVSSGRDVINPRGLDNEVAQTELRLQVTSTPEEKQKEDTAVFDSSRAPHTVHGQALRDRRKSKASPESTSLNDFSKWYESSVKRLGVHTGMELVSDDEEEDMVGLIIDDDPFASLPPSTTTAMLSPRGRLRADSRDSSVLRPQRASPTSMRGRVEEPGAPHDMHWRADVDDGVALVQRGGRRGRSDKKASERRRKARGVDSLAGEEQTEGKGDVAGAGIASTARRRRRRRRLMKMRGEPTTRDAKDEQKAEEQPSTSLLQRSPQRSPRKVFEQQGLRKQDVAKTTETDAGRWISEAEAGQSKTDEMTQTGDGLTAYGRDLQEGEGLNASFDRADPRNTTSRSTFHQAVFGTGGVKEAQGGGKARPSPEMNTSPGPPLVEKPSTTSTDRRARSASLISLDSVPAPPSSGPVAPLSTPTPESQLTPSAVALEPIRLPPSSKKVLLPKGFEKRLERGTRGSGRGSASVPPPGPRLKRLGSAPAILSGLVSSLSSSEGSVTSSSGSSVFDTTSSESSVGFGVLWEESESASLRGSQERSVRSSSVSSYSSDSDTASSVYMSDKNVWFDLPTDFDVEGDDGKSAAFEAPVSHEEVDMDAFPKHLPPSFAAGDDADTAQIKLQFPLLLRNAFELRHAYHAFWRARLLLESKKRREARRRRREMRQSESTIHEAQQRMHETLQMAMEDKEPWSREVRQDLVRRLLKSTAPAVEHVIRATVEEQGGTAPGLSPARAHSLEVPSGDVLLVSVTDALWEDDSSGGLQEAIRRIERWNRGESVPIVPLRRRHSQHASEEKPIAALPSRDVPVMMQRQGEGADTEHKAEEAVSSRPPPISAPAPIEPPSGPVHVEKESKPSAPAQVPLTGDDETMLPSGRGIVPVVPDALPEETTDQDVEPVLLDSSGKQPSLTKPKAIVSPPLGVGAEASLSAATPGAGDETSHPALRRRSTFSPRRHDGQDRHTRRSQHHRRHSSLERVHAPAQRSHPVPPPPLPLGTPYVVDPWKSPPLSAFSGGPGDLSSTTLRGTETRLEAPRHRDRAKSWEFEAKAADISDDNDRSSPLTPITISQTESSHDLLPLHVRMKQREQAASMRVLKQRDRKKQREAERIRYSKPKHVVQGPSFNERGRRSVLFRQDSDTDSEFEAAENAELAVAEEERREGQRYQQFLSSAREKAAQHAVAGDMRHSDYLFRMVRTESPVPSPHAEDLPTSSRRRHRGESPFRHRQRLSPDSHTGLLSVRHRQSHHHHHHSRSSLFSSSQRSSHHRDPSFGGPSGPHDHSDHHRHHHHHHHHHRRSSRLHHHSRPQHRHHFSHHSGHHHHHHHHQHGLTSHHARHRQQAHAPQSHRHHHMRGVHGHLPSPSQLGRAWQHLNERGGSGVTQPTPGLQPLNVTTGHNLDMYTSGPYHPSVPSTSQIVSQPSLGALTRSMLPSRQAEGKGGSTQETQP